MSDNGGPFHDKCIKIPHMKALTDRGAALEMSNEFRGVLYAFGKAYDVEKGICFENKFYSMSQVSESWRKDEKYHYYHIIDPEVEVDKALRTVGV